ncbi:MAG: divergent PAP2 family protein [Butyrivibrio sp.]|uniref:divergent PAP2 family protein n=1 Tax=Butyrivibrio sp. TaxID=28121 RepID=UPI0025E6D34C|nr:divergent PAP2 family protein [Butyrivibrio sp.]MCR5770402.1 divergent PAP2 family protein [Butyrivibrio sp.]
MADFFYEVTHNDIIMCPVIAWFTAQVLKTVIYMITYKEFNAERLLGDGGMPSSHSATVMSLVTIVGFEYGVSGYEFALAGILALITMHDAMGVRRETGKQAVVIKNLAELFEEMGKDIPDDEKLKVFVGHTPLQVIMGAILGVIVGSVYYGIAG